MPLSFGTKLKVPRTSSTPPSMDTTVLSGSLLKTSLSNSTKLVSAMLVNGTKSDLPVNSLMSRKRHLTNNGLSLRTPTPSLLLRMIRLPLVFIRKMKETTELLRLDLISILDSLFSNRTKTPKSSSSPDTLRPNRSERTRRLSSLRPEPTLLSPELLVDTSKPLRLLLSLTGEISLSRTDSVLRPSTPSSEDSSTTSSTRLMLVATELLMLESSTFSVRSQESLDSEMLLTQTSLREVASGSTTVTSLVSLEPVSSSSSTISSLSSLLRSRLSS